jgi:hypothetical protein
MILFKTTAVKTSNPTYWRVVLASAVLWQNFYTADLIEGGIRTSPVEFETVLVARCLVW